MKRAYTLGEKSLFAAPLLFIALGIGTWVWRRQMPIRVNVSDTTDISSLSFSPDGKKLAVSFRAERRRPVPILVFDLASHNKLCELTPPFSFMSEVAWSGDGQRIAAGYNDLESGSTRIPNPPRPNKKPAAFRLNDVGKIAVWNANSGDLIADFPYAPSDEDSRAASVRFSADGKTLIGTGHPTAIFDATTGKRLRVLSQNPTARINRELGLLAQIAGKDNRIQIIDLKTGRKIWESRQTGFGTTPLEVITWQGDILSLACERPPLVSIPPESRPSKTEEYIEGIEWFLWDAKTRSLQTFPFYNATITPQVNVDGKTLAFMNRQYLPPTPNSRAEDTREIVIWDYQSKQTLWRQPCTFFIYCLSWSPDGKWLSLLEEYPQDSLMRLKVYERSGKLHIERIVEGSLAVWSPDSRQIAVASSKREVSRQIEIVRIGD